MDVALISSRSPPTNFRCRVEISKNQRHQALQRGSLFLRSHFRKLSVTCSVKLPSAGHFGEQNKATTYLNRLSESLWKSFPEPVKHFPWRKAEDIILQRLLYLGQKALKWSFLALYIITFVSDVSLSVSRNKELMIPLGLFIGVTMADFLKETSQEFFHSSTKEWGSARQLLGIGSFFLLLKFITLYFTIPGWVFLSHISNGGLMQLLWLAKKLQEMEDNVDEVHTQSPCLDVPTSGNGKTET